MATKVEQVLASAQQLLQQGATERAVEALRKLVTTEQGDARAWLLLGEAEEMAGNRLRAIEGYQRAAALYADRGSYLQAVAIHKRKLLPLAPEMVSAHVRLAELYHYLGLVDDAMDQYMVVAKFYEQHGRRQEAREILVRVLDMKPGSIPARLRLAELYRAERQPEQAAAELAKVCEQLLERGQVADYVKVAERLIYLQPDDLTVSRPLVRTLLEAGNPKRALHHLQRILSIRADDEEGMDLLQRTFRALGQTAKAVQVLHELARIHDRAQRNEQQAAVYRQIIELAPEDSQARRALASLAGSVARRPGSVARPLAVPTPPRPGSGPLPGPAAPSPRPERSGGLSAGPGAMTPRPDPNGATPTGPGGPPPLPAAPSHTSHATATIQFQGPLPPNAVPAASLPRPATRPAPATPASRAPTPRAAVALPANAPMAANDLDTRPMRIEEFLGAAAGMTAAQQGPVRGEQLARMLHETRVYVKYGLKEKALDHISRILVQDPENIEALIFRKDLLLAERDFEAATLVLMRLADITRGDPNQSRRFIEEARRLGLGPAAAQQPPPQARPAAPQTPAEHRAATRPAPQQVTPVQQGSPAVPLSPAYAPGPPLQAVPRDPRQAPVPPQAAAQRLTAQFLQQHDHGDEPREVRTAAARAAAAPPLGPTQAAPPGAPAFRPPMTQAPSAQRGPGAPQPMQGSPAPPAAQRPSDRPLAPAQPAPRPAAAAGPGPARAPLPGPRPAPAPAPAAPLPDAVQEALQEVGFFLEHGLRDEALQLLRDTLRHTVDHPALRRRLAELSSAAAPRGASGPAPSPQAPQSSPGPRAPLPAEPPRTAAPLTPAAAPRVAAAPAPTPRVNPAPAPGLAPAPRPAEVPAPAPDPSAGLDPMPDPALRSGAPSAAVGNEDGETHYDLGIAYMEMGLVQDAIHEFRTAMEADVKRAECHRLIGRCYLQAGSSAEALAWLKRGLRVAGLTDQQRLGLYFGLGEAQLASGDREEARRYLEQVAAAAPTYPGLRELLRRAGHAG